jgi:hypothetical protein
MTLSSVSSSAFESIRAKTFSSLEPYSPVLIWQWQNQDEGKLPPSIASASLVFAQSCVLLPNATRCSIGILPIPVPIVGAWLDQVDDHIHSLQVLARLCNALPAGSPIAWQREPEAASSPSHWLEFWLRSARRLGCTIEAHTADGALVRTPMNLPDWSLDFASENYRYQIQSLFHEVFGGDLTDTHYQWKYATTGGGVVAVAEGKVIAFCGALMREVLICSEPNRAAQLVDVMVHPNYRGILRKQGVFFETTASAIELFGPLAFGFPNARHLKLGQKHGFYEPVDPLVELEWPVNTATTLPIGSDRLVEIDFSNPKHCKNITRQWQAMASDLAKNTVGIRDMSWIQYRYLNHPIYKHFFFAVTCRWTGRWKGIVIGRKENDSFLILDWIGQLTYLPALVHAAIRFAKQHNCTLCTTWATEYFSRYFKATQPILREPNVTVPTIVWCQDPKEQTLRHWWISPGDSDFR